MINKYYFYKMIFINYILIMTNEQRQEIITNTFLIFEQLMESEDEVIELYDNLFEEVNNDLLKIKKMIEEKNKINKKWHSIKSKFRSITHSQNLEDISIDNMDDIQKLQFLSFNLENKDEINIEDYNNFIDNYKKFYLILNPNDNKSIEDL